MISEITTGQIDCDRHYLTGYNGETWKSGFDIPFCRTQFFDHDIDRPFQDIVYADVVETVVDRFDTNEQHDLVGVYEQLTGNTTCDPFEDSGAAVSAFEAVEWLPLLKHNPADIQRTRELAQLADRFVPQSDFSMKNLQPTETRFITFLVTAFSKMRVYTSAVRLIGGQDFVAPLASKL